MVDSTHNFTTYIVEIAVTFDCRLAQDHLEGAYRIVALVIIHEEASYHPYEEVEVETVRQQQEGTYLPWVCPFVAICFIRNPFAFDCIRVDLTCQGVGG